MSHQTFQCPNCNASLDYDGHNLTIRCDYCNTSVIVPESLRASSPLSSAQAFSALPGQIAQIKEIARLARSGRKAEATQLYRSIFGGSMDEASQAVDRLAAGNASIVTNISMGDFPTTTIDPQTVSRVGRTIGCATFGFILLMILLTVGVPLVVMAAIGDNVVSALFNQVFSTVTETTTSTSSTTSSTPVPEVNVMVQEALATAFPSQVLNPADTGFAQVVLTFGGEGIGPGLFEDARHIGVDGDGNIYVADYIGGRIQKFDATGKFITLWMVDTKLPLTGLAVDRQGTVYVVQSGRITRYDGATGQSLGQLPGDFYDHLTLTADGSLIASVYRNQDDIVRLDNQGNETLRLAEAISGQTGDSELNTLVAADGLGNIYALGTFNEAVFKFGPDGKFINRFGGDGDQPGQFRAPGTIAVDGQGRVYVSDFKGIQVFDSTGRYLDLIQVDGYAFGLVFNDQNELFVAARTQVVKYTINE